jgi:hypothetical protein
MASACQADRLLGSIELDPIRNDRQIERPKRRHFCCLSLPSCSDLKRLSDTDFHLTCLTELNFDFGAFHATRRDQFVLSTSETGKRPTCLDQIALLNRVRSAELYSRRFESAWFGRWKRGGEGVDGAPHPIGLCRRTFSDGVGASETERREGSQRRAIWSRRNDQVPIGECHTKECPGDVSQKAAYDSGHIHFTGISMTFGEVLSSSWFGYVERIIEIRCFRFVQISADSDSFTRIPNEFCSSVHCRFGRVEEARAFDELPVEQRFQLFRAKLFSLVERKVKFERFNSKCLKRNELTGNDHKKRSIFPCLYWYP